MGLVSGKLVCEGLFNLTARYTEEPATENNGAVSYEVETYLVCLLFRPDSEADCAGLPAHQQRLRADVERDPREAMSKGALTPTQHILCYSSLKLRIAGA